MNYIDKITDANALVSAFYKSEKNCRWKYSVQKYELSVLENSFELQTSIRNKTYKQKEFFEFTLSERGKTRPIKSMYISDRVVQRDLCDETLVPILTPFLIYDNGASMKDKGISHARNRLKCHLERYYRKYGNEGYILQIDFSKFFDNIQHEKLARSFEEKIDDKEFMTFVRQLIDAFKIDVSYMTDEEYLQCLNVLYNSIEYRKLPKDSFTGEKYMAKSVGIGSQISQISGVYYPGKIDTYCKTVKGLKYYGRYMDDIYVLHPDKEYLKQLLIEIENISSDLGLFINKRKTQIVKLSHGFTFIGGRYLLTETGKVIVRLKRESITRERKKLKKYYELYYSGRMPKEEIYNAYQSWRGNAKQFNSYKSLLTMDAYYKRLFGGKKQ